MSKQIELTLTSLLPTLSPLPLDLINLASSLLAQSRAKAASLKAEEEIGRTYACCHIACERLGSRFGLELGKPAPPVTPKVYHKLHAYLSSVLKNPSAPSTPQTRRFGDAQGGTPVSPRMGARGEGNATPRYARTEGILSTLGKRSGGITQKAVEVQLPVYTMSLIKHVCKELGTSEAAPHVFAGLESVYPLLAREAPAEKEARRETASKKRKVSARTNAVPSSEGSAEQALPALVAVIYSYTASKLYDLDSTDTEDERVDEGKILAVVRSFYNTGSARSSAPLKADEDLKAEIAAFTREAVDWVKMEWYTNIPSNGQTSPSMDLDDAFDLLSSSASAVRGTLPPAKTPLRRKEKHGPRSVGFDVLGAAGLEPGLGTMFQPAVDWLALERRAEYERWERDVRRRIAAGV